MEVISLIEKLGNGKDKIVGKVKETAGQILDDEEMEFQGKMQSLKSDIGSKVENIKDSVLEKTNDFIDRVKDMKNNK